MIEQGPKLYRREMPYSEVCMHMRIAGMTFLVENIGNHMVQLYKNGRKFSAPITWGEAGITPMDQLAIKWEEADENMAEVRSRG